MTSNGDDTSGNAQNYQEIYDKPSGDYLVKHGRRLVTFATEHVFGEYFTHG